MAFSTTPEMLCSNPFLPTTIEPSVLISKNAIGGGSLRNEDRERSFNTLYAGNPSVSIFAQDPSPLRKVTANTRLSPFPSFNFLPKIPQTESVIQPFAPFDTSYFNKSPFADDLAPSIPPPAPILEGELLPELLQCSVDQENYSTFDLEQTKLIKSPPSVNTQPLAIESSLAELVDSDGGLLKLDMVPKFMELMSNETSPEGRSILITVMMASRPLFQKQFITEGGLAICDTWLNETKKIVPLILKLLLKLPVDLEALQVNGRIGKTIRKLAGASNQDPKVQKLAKKLFDNWKKTVERASKPKKRQIQEPAVGEPPKKKAKVKQTNGINSSKAFGANLSSKPFENAATAAVKKEPLLNRTKNQAPRTIQVISATTPVSKLGGGASAPFDNKSSNQQQSSSSIVVKKHSEAPLSADDIKKQKQQRKIKDNRKRALNENSAAAISENSKNQAINSPPTPGSLQSPTSKPSEILEATNPPKKKKTVTWARDSEIAKIKYFPRDKTLGWRGQNNNLPPPSQQQPATNARQGSTGSPSASVSRPTQSFPFKPAIPWYIPHRLDLPPAIKVGSGENSKEKFVQEYREKDIPPSIYANGQIPPNPIECEEPEVEVNDNNLPLIPLEDMTREPVAPVSDPHPPIAPPVTYNTVPVVQQPLHQAPVVNSLAPAVLQLLTNQGGLQQVLSLLAAGNNQPQVQPQYAPGYTQAAFQQYPPNVQYNYPNYPVQAQPYENMNMSQVANMPNGNQQYYMPRY